MKIGKLIGQILVCVGLVAIGIFFVPFAISVFLFTGCVVVIGFIVYAIVQVCIHSKDEIEW